MRPALSRAIVAAAALVTVAAAAPDAEACSCLPPNLQSIYAGSTDVMRGRVIWKLAFGTQVAYWVSVTDVYKGCRKPGDVVVIRTHVSSATCGASGIPVGSDHLFNASADAGGALHINLCGYNVAFASLTAAQVDFLESRYNCCGGKCACVAGDQVACFVNPCQVASCPVGKCTANYCGGCRAEFTLDDGKPVCNACSSNADCAFGLVCSAGRCLPPLTLPVLPITALPAVTLQR